MTTTPNANRKTASKKTTRRIARKLTSTFTRKTARAISRRKQLEMKAALERHSRRCIICHHPEREAIEEEFLHWRAPWKLAEDYSLADYRTLYRHARAAGLLLQRRENLHSGLDAFVEAVDDVKFTGDTILRAMRAYSCIDRHGRWTEIPTQVNISTFRDPGPAPSPAPHPENDSDVIDIEPEQLDEDLEEDEEEYDEEGSELDDPGDDDSDTEPEYSNRASRRDETAATAPQSNPSSRSDSTACSGPPAQDSGHDAAAVDDNPEDDPPADESEDDGDPDTVLEEDEVLDEHATAYAASLAQAVEKLTAGSNHRGRTATATARAGSPAQSGTKQYSNPASRSDSTPCAVLPAQAVPTLPLDSQGRGRNAAATDCAASPAQATPRNEVRGHNLQSRSTSDHTTCAVSPAQPAPHAHAWQNPLPPPAPLTDYPPVYPIYGPAIKNHRKARYSSSLRFSNRR